jgi:hypothetical protein
MSFAKAGTFVLAFLVMLVLAAIAGLGVSLSKGSLRPATPSPAAIVGASPAETVGASPAEIVASRFPSADETWPSQAVTFSTASVMPVENWERFDPDALSGMATVEPPWPTTEAQPDATETAKAPISETVGDSATSEEAAKTELSNPQAAGTPARRGTSRSSNVLNDAQIASIKRRLKLTAQQEQMWPAVEAALRKIVYTKNAMHPQAHAAQGSSTVYIDPSSAEVRELKSAAVPLLMHLNDEQKREVKMLAYVMGLEAVASQF